MADKASLKPKSAPAYVDRYVRVDSAGITLLDYYFPIGDNFLSFAEIDLITIVPAYALGFYGRKGWGMSISGVWWGLDFGRPFNSDRILVMIDANNDAIRKGASVENFAAFHAALVQHAPQARRMVHPALHPPALTPMLAPPPAAATTFQGK